MEKSENLFSMEEHQNERFCMHDAHGKKVTTLRGQYAERMFTVLQKQDPDACEMFNCFGTMNYVLARENVLRKKFHKASIENTVPLSEAMQLYTFPFGFELWGEWEAPGEFDMGYESHYCIFHEGLVVHKADDFIVFDKPGRLPPRITTLQQVITQYPETEEIKCFPFPLPQTSHPA